MKIQLVGIIIMLGLGSACNQEPPKLSLPSYPKQAEPTVLFEGFHMRSMNSDSPEWDFSARAAQIFERDQWARAQDISVIYYDKGKPVSTLTAGRGFFETQGRNMRAEQNVVMVSQEGSILKTELLQWDNTKNKIFTDRPVTVIREGNVLTGIGLLADSELKHIEILSRVDIRVRSWKSLQNVAPSPVSDVKHE
jgi:LPS export ABC transporter protein LptC